MKQSLKFLWQSIREYRIFYLIMIIAPVLGAFYKPIVYYAIKMMVDIISKPGALTFSQLLYPLLIYFLADISLSAIWRISNIAAWKSDPYVQKNILLRALKTTLFFRYSFFQNTPGGSLVSKIKGLLTGYIELWSQLWYGVLFWCLVSLTTGASILLVNVKLALILLFWSVIFIVINYFFAKKINTLSQVQSEAQHGVIGEISDTLNNIQSVKLFARQSYEYSRLQDRITNDFVPKNIKFAKYQFKIDLFNDIMTVGIILIILVIMIQLRRLNMVSIGDFVFVFGMIFQFQENLWHLMQEFHKLSNRMGDLRSSLTLYDDNVSESVPDAKPLKLNPNQLPSIEFRNLDFSYNSQKSIFENLNLVIKSGERVGIVGFTGAGKTTLTNLLLKIFSPENGQVLIENQDIANIDCDTIREHIAIIPQHIDLFHRNLMENIRYGRLDASDSEVIEAAIKAHAHEFIIDLADGYQTLVGERGIKLSGGQKQRIAIARAILKNSPILILDEATSSLDSITEQYIQDSIKELLVDKTVLAIAHRLSTLKNMDRLIVVDNGQIIESGTHDELLANTHSLYAKIWHTQYSHLN